MSRIARAEDGKWFYLFERNGDRPHSTRLVNMAEHDNQLEPNVHFSPDGRWRIFHSNMHGQSQIYAVDLTSAPSSGSVNAEDRLRR
jgi:oligogalacturonide lyase